MTLPHLFLLLRLGAADPAADSPAEPDAAPLPSTPTSKPVLDAATCSKRPTECVAAAGAEFDARNFPEAVRLFEALVTAHPDVHKYHYFAGLARESAGDDTAAYVHMRNYLASDTKNLAERKRATRRTAAILARTTKLTLQTPAYTAPVNLRLTRLGAAHRNATPLVIPLVAVRTTGETHELALTPGEWELALDPARLGDMEAVPRRIEVFDGMKTMTVEISTRPVRHELTLELGPARALKRGIRLDLHRINGPTLGLKTRVPGVHRELPPGTWVYEVKARGFLPQTQTITLNGPHSVTLELTPKWSDDRRKRLKLGLGLAGAGLATGIAGAGLLAHADKRQERFHDQWQDVTSNGCMPNTCRSKNNALNIADVGSALVGTTFGLWTGAASSASHSRRLLLTEAAVGATAILGGTLWFWSTSRGAENPFDSTFAPQRSLGERNIGALVAASFLGFGSGLLISTIGNLANNKKLAATSQSKTTLGLTLSPNSARIHIKF